jgi:hypothetical protein
MANSPADVVTVDCEKCADSISCPYLNPYRCNSYVPALSSNFMIETHISLERVLFLEDTI